MRSDASYAALGVLVAWLAIAALASGGTTPVRDQPRSAEARPALRPQAAPSTTNLRALRDGQRIDLNRATHAELELLPGIGPRLAQRILEARVARGQFGDVADLADVSGIGPAKLATLTRLTCAGARCALEPAAQRSNAQTNDSALTK